MASILRAVYCDYNIERYAINQMKISIYKIDPIIDAEIDSLLFSVCAYKTITKETDVKNGYYIFYMITDNNWKEIKKTFLKIINCLDK